MAQLLEQGRQQCRVLLNHLPHVLELGLVPQELQGVLSCWQEEGVQSDTMPDSQKFGGRRVQRLDSRHPTCTSPQQLTSFCGWLLRHLALLDRTMFRLGASRNSLSGVLFSSNAEAARYLPSACSALAEDG